MPKENEEKTKSALKYSRVAVIAIAVLLLAAILWPVLASRTKTLHVGNHTYQLTVASTMAEQAKGLGDLANMPANQGMLFPFSKPAVQCFWMKDMHFSLDMLWLNSSKQVVHIEPNVSPNTYPKTFCPNEPAQYVIELNAGQAKAAGITTGQTLTF